MSLVLTRHRDEAVILKTSDGTTIKIVVVRIDDRNRVRLAVSAPDSVEIIREELMYQSEKGWRRGKDTHDEKVR
jgi:carbon storage regulator CsrA